LLLGFVLLAAQWASSPAFFRGETLPMRHSGDLLLYGDTQPLLADPLTLPDSREHTVIAPDLSNLPPGTRAVDPTTSKTFEKDGD
jgi:hypothetical protein